MPEGVEEILPDEAAKLENLRRQILDDFAGRGFNLVMPPVMEFVDSLLTGTGEALDTQTYKFMDQHTHRMLGIRADMTPQIARIDAHYLSDNEVNRLCYAGTVLRTQPDQMGGQREVFQIGAELFGIDGQSADIEIIDAMLASLRLSQASSPTLSIGHVGIYRTLIDAIEISEQQENQLFDALLRKSLPDLSDLEQELGCSSLVNLLALQGGVETLKSARDKLPDEHQIHQSLDEITSFVEHLEQNYPSVNLHIDLADVMGYRYHTGLKYSAYVDGRGRAIAKGGRYDRIGELFGRARPATGFSADLKLLLQLSI